MKMTCFSRRVKIEECKSFERFLFSKKKIETVAIKTNRVDIYRVGENINIHDVERVLAKEARALERVVPSVIVR